MKKQITIMLIALIAIIGSVFAYQGVGMMNAQNSINEKGTFHEDVESIIETGTYQNLINLREELGFNIMRKVQTEEDFNEMKERHELMEEQGIEPGYLRNNVQRDSQDKQSLSQRNKRQNQGMNLKGNCPYLN